jgi:chemotaxis response regulator CheB
MNFTETEKAWLQSIEATAKELVDAPNKHIVLNMLKLHEQFKTGISDARRYLKEGQTEKAKAAWLSAKSAADAKNCLYAQANRATKDLYNYILNRRN